MAVYRFTCDRGKYAGSEISSALSVTSHALTPPIELYSIAAIHSLEFSDPMNVHPPEDIAGPEPSPQPDQVEACEPARISIQAQIGADACKTILSVWGTLKARQDTRTSV